LRSLFGFPRVRARCRDTPKSDTDNATIDAFGPVASDRPPPHQRNLFKSGIGRAGKRLAERLSAGG
jgi:hypothetical protein